MINFTSESLICYTPGVIRYDKNLNTVTLKTFEVFIFCMHNRAIILDEVGTFFSNYVLSTLQENCPLYLGPISPTTSPAGHSRFI